MAKANFGHQSFQCDDCREISRAERTLIYDFGFLGFGLSWFASAVLSDISISERIASLRNARLTPTPTRPE